MSYNIYSGIVSSGINLSYDTMRVYSGGIANDTTLNWEGSMSVSSGGVANDTTVSQGGEIYVGGIANDTIVSAYGSMCISSGGVANNAIIMQGTIYISSGGSANDVIIDSWGKMHISNGGFANSTTVNNGYLYISSGGTATDIIWTPCVGQIYAEDGAYVTYASDYSGVYLGSSNAQVMDNIILSGTMYVMNNGFANSTTVNSGGRLYISSGGNAIAIKENGGYVDIKRGANVTFIENTFSDFVLQNDIATLHSGTTANDTIINYGGWLTILSRGIANGAAVNSGGWLVVSSGGTANNTSVNSGGWLDVSSGGAANNTIVCSGGWLDIYAGAIVNSTTVNSGGEFTISSGGTANSTTVNSNGRICVSEGGIINDTCNSQGGMCILSGGIANNTTIKSGGMHISGGVANSTIVNSGGISITSGGKANSININAGSIDVWDGEVNNLTVNSGVTLSMAGGSATYVKENGGCVWVNGGAKVTFVENTFSNLVLKGRSCATLHSGTTAYNTVIDSMGGLLVIYSSGIANNTTVNGSGSMRISNGGIANNTVVNHGGYISGGLVYVSSGGLANRTTLNAGRMHVSSHGEAVSTTVESGGLLTVFSGGTATYIKENGGYVEENYGAKVTFVENTFSNLVLKGRGSASLHSGTTANDTIVDGFGNMHIFSGGIANNTTINSGGSIYISSGGVANNTTVSSRGNICIYSGGKHTGFLQIATGVFVSAYNGAIVDFTVAEQKTSDTYLINDLSRIWNAFFTITVNSNQENGIYKLAQGAIFNGTGSIPIGDSCEDYGLITVNSDDLIYKGKSYSLDLNDGNLTLSIEKSLSAPVANADITALTNKDVTVTAMFSDKTFAKEYSYDNSIWSSYIAGIVMSENGSVYFRGQDSEGYYSDVTEYKVTNIDKDAPTKPTASANITSATNMDVTVTATFSEDSVVKEYSLDNQIWHDYTAGIKFADNGSVYFRGQDEAGNYTDVIEYKVTNIDKVVPSLVITGNVTDWTNQDVTLKATANEEGVIEYFSDGKWISGNVLTVSENGTYYFSVTDVAGNITEQYVEVSHIDKVAPEQVQIEVSNSGKWLSVTRSDSNDLGSGIWRYHIQISQDADFTTVKNYAYMGGNTYNKIILDDGTYYIRMSVEDYVENISEWSNVASLTIDTVAPAIPVASADITNATNKDVTVTARFSDDSVTKEYSLDNSIWRSYTDGIKFSSNGVVYFRAEDAAGNMSEVSSYTVSNIDKVAPTIAIVVSTTALTNKDVTVTASVTDSDSGIKSTEYSFDNQTWISGTSVAVTENKTVYFKTTDYAGNTVTDSIVIGNIDKVAPKLDITADITSPTNGNVKLTAVASDGTVEYFENGEWIVGTEYTVSDNGTYQFRVTDAAGNVTGKSIVIGNIDKIVPTLDIAADVITPTNGNVKLTATASDGTVEFFENGEWSIGSEYTVSSNGTYQFRVTDAAGNITEKSVVISNIDKVAPTLDITASTTTLTNKDVTVTATVTDSDSGIKSTEYSFDNQTWFSGTSVAVTENKTVYFKTTDYAGNTVTDSIVIGNVDKIAPKLDIAADITTPTNGNVKLTAVASDGKVEYFDNGEWITGAEYTVSDNGTYQFRVTDAAGNITEKSVVISNIDKVAPTLDITASTTTLTNKDVTATASVIDSDSGIKSTEYSFDNQKWFSGTSVTVTENKTVYFKTTDYAGNTVTDSIVIGNIDKVAPTLDITADVITPTNGNVKLTAVANDGKVEYFDNGEWIVGTENYVSDNGIYQFRATDAAGNVTEKSIVISNIDKVAPTLEITADITTPTNGNVKLTAKASDGTVEYFDNGEWITGTEYTVYDNGTYQFRVTDDAGNITEKSIVISNIDKVAPTIDLVASTTALINKDVTVTATVTDSDSGIKSTEYSFDNKTWISGTSVSVTENKTIYFKAIDYAGNTVTDSIVIGNIDKVIPEKPTASANITSVTNKDVTVTAVFSADSTKKEYSFDNKTWQSYTAGVKFTANGSVYFRGQDEAGNISAVASYTVSNIDKVAPSKPIASANITSATNNDVTVTAVFSDDSVVKEYSFDNETWQSYIASIKFIDNGSVYFRGQDKAGNISAVTEYKVSNIDKVAPTISVTETISKQSVVLTAEVSDNASGIKNTQYSFDNNTWQEGSNVTICFNGTVYFRAVDNAGNVTVKSTVVDSNEEPASNLLSNGVSQIVAWDKEKGAVGYVATDGTPGNKWRGIWDWDGKDVELWRVVGVGRFAGSKVDHDGILLYNGIGNTFAAWTNLNNGDYGYVNLCHVDGNFNTKCLTDLANDDYDDVLIYDEKGSFGVVLDGTTYQDIWHVAESRLNVWQLCGAGNFGGDQDKLVVRNNSGHLYFWKNNDSTFKTWNWSQEVIGYVGNDFEFVGVGDFKGDGIDDILLRKTSDNGLWVWEDGNASKASWQVTPGNGFKVEAIGDYNGDGKDDVLVREYNTGWGGLGYYAFGGDTLWNDLNARIETNLESKFAVIA